jgi:uncharacterized protein YutE (UPF0331/DUF86 family)
MSPSLIDAAIVSAKTEIVDEMLRGLRGLPNATLEEFLSDPRNPAAAESYLRRALEALLDLGRHLLAKGFGKPVTEYAAIADALHELDILSAGSHTKLRQMAKYRNRMVHLYDAIGPEEIYGILTGHLGDFEDILAVVDSWLAAHPDKIRREL